MPDPGSSPDLTSLVDRWVAAWVRSRTVSFERIGRGWLLDVAAESRESEYVFADPTVDELQEFAGLIAPRSTHWLTIVGELSATQLSALEPVIRVTEDEMIMTSTISATSRPAEVVIDERGGVAFAQVLREGRTAAFGQAALNGTDAVFDRIGTQPEFRRMGLGRAIMTGLTSWAADRGATIGVLGASAEGRPLYRGLGWREVAPLASFRGSGES